MKGRENVFLKSSSFRSSDKKIRKFTGFGLRETQKSKFNPFILQMRKLSLRKVKVA